MKTQLTVETNGFHGYSSKTIWVDAQMDDDGEMTARVLRRTPLIVGGCSSTCTCGEGYTVEPGAEYRVTGDVDNLDVLEIEGNYPQNQSW